MMTRLFALGVCCLWLGCQAPPTKPRALVLRQNTEVALGSGATVTFLHGGHEIGAPPGRAGDDRLFVVLRFARGDQTTRVTVDARSWRAPKETLGVSWRGVGEVTWEPDEVTIEVSGPTTGR